MTDLTTRLRELADESDIGIANQPFTVKSALRDAAAALASVTSDRDFIEGAADRQAMLYIEGIKKLEQERDDLKTKLDVSYGEQAKQLAQIVALKAALAGARHDIDMLIRNDRAERAEAEAAALREALRFYAEGRHVERDAMHEYAADTGKRAKQALSQPGPGAALLERVRKLEAVAEAVQYESRFFKPESDLPLRVLQALAALDE